ncbi:MAG TPA: MFS transporter [Actinobacteria bacterium]|nr:MFS transporter [Actinomycetota bacterium]
MKDKMNEEKTVSSSQIELLEAETACPKSKMVVLTTKGLKRLFASLSHRDFRYFFVGALISNVGTWIQMVALGWLVYELTGSSFYLGLITFAGNLPILLFALFAGAVADRLNRRVLILWSQGILVVFAIVLGVITSAKVATIFNVALLNFGAGIALAFSFPAWQAIISDLVPRKDLLNAIALNSAQFNTARLIGPFFAGLILSIWGVAACFYVNGVSFLTVIVALFLMQTHVVPQKHDLENVWEHIVGGICYARNHPTIAMLLLIMAVLTVFGMPFSVLMPVFAGDILKVGARGNAFLLAANGLGALLGALTVAYVASVAKKENLIKTGLLMFGLFLMAFAFSKNYLLSLILLVMVGAAFLTTASSINTSIQSAVPNEVRGRVMGIFVWIFMGFFPIGSIVFGSIAQFLTAPVAVSIGALVCLFMSIFLFVRPDLLKEIC